MLLRGAVRFRRGAVLLSVGSLCTNQPRSPLSPSAPFAPFRGFSLFPSLFANTPVPSQTTNKPVAAAPKAEPVPIHYGVIPRLILPLSSGEKCSFPLHLNETVRDLVIDIREEDRGLKEIVFLDPNDLRIAHSTRLEDLIKSPFTVSLDSRRYSVEPKSRTASSLPTTLGNVEIQDLALKAYYRKLVERLRDANHHHMPYAEYLVWCSEFGITEEQGRELSRALHLTGEILHFHDNDKLKDFIFLEPNTITEELAEQLDLKYVKKNTAQLRRDLDQILPKFLAINKIKQELDAKSEIIATRHMWYGGIYLVAQFGILARMVWIDFNWDIMEPISYFVGLSTMLVGVLFFVLYRTEYTYYALRDRQRLKALRKLYISKEFNWQRWNNLNEKINYYREQLGEANLPAELKGIPK